MICILISLHLVTTLDIHILPRAYDYLPLVIQADLNGKAELFELPLNCAPSVNIFHPKYPELSRQLKMEWYPMSFF